MSKSTLKAMTRSRDLKVGHFVLEFATPGIGHILKAAGCDYVFLDMEHSGFGFETVKACLRYCEAAQLPVILRVPSQDYHMLARACDVGAEGIMAPMVSTVAQATAIIDSVKYVPEGKRGVALGIAHDNFQSLPVKDSLAAANAKTTFFCLIETAEGVENADAIAALKGVDCIWVGHFDLSCSLGIAGEFEHPRFLAAMDKIIAAAKHHGKSLGRLLNSPQQAAACHAQGFDFCCYSGDIWVLRDALTAAVRDIRKACQ